MKVEIELVTEAALEGAKISTIEITDSVELAKQLLENNAKGIPAVKEERTYLIEPDNIYYAESIDSKCFIYTKKDCFEVKYKLYELEMMLDYRFFRCSKSMICNVKKIRSVNCYVVNEDDFCGMNLHGNLNDEDVRKCLYLEDEEQRFVECEA